MLISLIQVNDLECIESSMNKGIWIKLTLLKIDFILFKLGKQNCSIVHCDNLKCVVLQGSLLGYTVHCITIL